MKPLFVDTSGWMSCADAADPRHLASLAVRDEWLQKGGILLTSDYVVDEMLTLTRMRLGMDAAEHWWKAISSSQRVRVLPLDGNLLDAARIVFFRYRDKNFSFTDCTSFAVMRKNRLRDALATDHHFQQAGFRCLPEN